jgi:hypothetical protein
MVHWSRISGDSDGSRVHAHGELPSINGVAKTVPGLRSPLKRPQVGLKSIDRQSVHALACDPISGPDEEPMLAFSVNFSSSVDRRDQSQLPMPFTNLTRSSEAWRSSCSLPLPALSYDETYHRHSVSARNDPRFKSEHPLACLLLVPERQHGSPSYRVRSARTAKFSLQNTRLWIVMVKS